MNTSGLTATVLTTPDGRYQGLNFNSIYPGRSITVASGVVTSSNLVFQGSDRNGTNNYVDYLWLGLISDYQGNTYTYFNPGYYIDNGNVYTLKTPTGGLTFSAATPVPFEFDPSFGLVALGGIWAGRKVIKKIKTSKKSV